MNTFWLVAAIMMLACLAFILVPLSRPRAGGGASAASASMAIHRDRLRELELAYAGGATSAEAYAAARDDIARQVLADAGAQDEGAGTPSAADRGALLGSALLLPALAMAGYFWLGDVGVLNELAAARAGSPHGGATHGVTEMVARLEARLRTEPEDAGGWALLGRSQGYLGQHDKAVAAFSRANALEPDNVGLMADLAEAVMMANGHRMDARARALLDAVLTREPEHPKARLLLSLRQDAQVLPTAGNAAAAPVAGHLKVRVTLAPALRAALPPAATVFIYARAAQGAPMPLAVVRRPAAELPLEVTLSDAEAVMPGRRLSQVASVIVGARVSASGNATAAAGDLEGLSAALEWTRTGNAHVEIDHVRP